jgi:microcystin-dependent protein
MSKPLKPRRGTTAENNAFVGESYEITYDTDKNTLVCRDGLTAGGFPLAKEEEVSSLDSTLRALIANSVPTGAVVAFAANSEPQGSFLLCNGADVSRTTYAKLFETIGTTYGGGNGSTTFTLPNLMDKFIQGGGTAGATKAAGLPNITANVYRIALNAGTIGNAGVGAFTATDESSNYAPDGAKAGHYKSLAFDASKSNGIYGASTTVQPPAVTMRYYIKY